MAASCCRKNCGSGHYIMYRECIVIVLVLLALTTVVSESPHLSRKITILYNEQCNQTACHPPDNTTGSYNNLAHVIAKGPNDTLHYLWSSIGAPGVLLVRTSNEAQLTVDWDKLLGQEADALVFKPSQDVMYSMAFVFARLIEYNDTKDKADLQMAFANETYATALEKLKWQDTNSTINETTHSGVFNTSADAQLGTNATLALKFQAYNSTGRSDSLPHLQSTQNTSQVELILQNLGLHYKQTRFAVELLVLHDQKTSDDVTLSLEKSIDDEYTPSVFEIFNIKIPSSSHQGSFSQWKPVTYNQMKKSLQNAIQTKNYGLNTTNYFTPNFSIAHAFYSDFKAVHKVGLNVSFGIPKDGFYTATNYTSWTITIGYGTPPQETISLTIIIIISAGLGIPLILILFGGIYVGVKKKLSAKDTKYESFPTATPGSINT